MCRAVLCCAVLCCAVLCNQCPRTAVSTAGLSAHRCSGFDHDAADVHGVEGLEAAVEDDIPACADDDIAGRSGAWEKGLPSGI